MSALLIATIGLPASGKSTFAARYITSRPPGTVMRTNRDLLRTMLHAGVYDGHNTEVWVVLARDLILSEGLSAGKTMICDDTNFRCVDELQRMADRAEARFELQDFRHVPVETCVERDAVRVGSAHVGEQVIRKMHADFIA